MTGVPIQRWTDSEGLLLDSGETLTRFSLRNKSCKLFQGLKENKNIKLKVSKSRSKPLTSGLQSTGQTNNTTTILQR
ncbi:UNVERIFIED_CONTAM: hypothetical protein FKN15_026563 [Acipenser sinensis]